MARAPRLHRGGRGFEPLITHHSQNRLTAGFLNGECSVAHTPELLGNREVGVKIACGNLQGNQLLKTSFQRCCCGPAESRSSPYTVTRTPNYANILHQTNFKVQPLPQTRVNISRQPINDRHGQYNPHQPNKPTN